MKIKKRFDNYFDWLQENVGEEWGFNGDYLLIKIGFWVGVIVFIASVIDKILNP